MSRDGDVEKLIRNLILLGYNHGQVRKIVHAALGRHTIQGAVGAERAALVSMLEQYVRLGEEFVMDYSK